LPGGDLIQALRALLEGGADINARNENDGTPLMGIASCLLLMFSLPPENWLRLFVWAAIGLAIYFGYGRRRSILARPVAVSPARAPSASARPS